MASRVLAKFELLDRKVAGQTRGPQLVPRRPVPPTAQTKQRPTTVSDSTSTFRSRNTFHRRRPGTSLSLGKGDAWCTEATPMPSSRRPHVARWNNEKRGQPPMAVSMQSNALRRYRHDVFPRLSRCEKQANTRRHDARNRRKNNERVGEAEEHIEPVHSEVCETNMNTQHFDEFLKIANKAIVIKSHKKGEVVGPRKKVRQPFTIFSQVRNLVGMREKTCARTKECKPNKITNASVGVSTVQTAAPENPQVFENVYKHRFYQCYSIARKHASVHGFSKKIFDGGTDDDKQTKQYLEAFVARLIIQEKKRRGIISVEDGDYGAEIRSADIAFHTALIDHGISPMPFEMLLHDEKRVSHILDFSDQHIGPSRGMGVAAWLQTTTPNSCKVLNVTRCCLGNSLRFILESILVNHLDSIESLILADNKIDQKTLLVLIRIITWKRLHRKKRSRDLHNIDLSRTGLGDWLGFIFLRALIPCQHTETIRMRACGLGQESAIMLSELLSFSTVLKTVDVSENKIYGAGAMAIALSMRTNKYLRVLELGWNSFAYTTGDNADSWVDAKPATLTHIPHAHGVRDYTIVCKLLLTSIAAAKKHLTLHEIIQLMLGRHKFNQQTHQINRQECPYHLFPIGTSGEDAAALLPSRVAFFGAGCYHTQEYWEALTEMMKNERGDDLIRFELVTTDEYRRAVSADSEFKTSAEYRPVLGKYGKKVVVAMASISKLKNSSEKVGIVLRTSDAMFEACHAGNKDPHHHAHQHTKRDAKEQTPELYPVVGVKADPLRHSLERRKILHAVNTHIDVHTPAEVLLAGLVGNTHLEVLGLEQNGVQNSLCVLFAKILKSATAETCALKEIKLSDNPGISAFGGTPLSEAQEHLNFIKGFKLAISFANTPYTNSVNDLQMNKTFREKLLVASEASRTRENQRQELHQLHMQEQNRIKTFLTSYMPTVITTAIGNVLPVLKEKEKMQLELQPIKEVLELIIGNLESDFNREAMTKMILGSRRQKGAFVRRKAKKVKAK